MPGKHAAYGGSSAYIWLDNCPGMIKLSEGLPDLPESKYAREGTAAHQCLEMFVKCTHRAEVQGTELFLLEDHSEDMVNHAKKIAAWICSRVPEGAILEAESRSSLEYIHPQAWGTADITIIELFKKLTVIDLKYGKGMPVEVKDNVQLMYYALGKAHEYGFEFNEIEIVIVQPRAPHPDGPYRSQSFPMSRLRKFEKRIRAGIEVCEASRKGENLASGAWCKWCKANLTCPEISERKLQQAQIDFASPVVKVPEVRQISDAKLCKILNAANDLDTWIKSVRAYAFNELKRGRGIKGWKLVDSKARRTWNDPTGLERALLKLKRRDTFEITMRSPAQMEKVTSKKFVKKHATSVSSGYSMVREDDRRKAVNPVEDDFK